MTHKQWFNNVLHLHPVHEEGAERLILHLIYLQSYKDSVTVMLSTLKWKTLESRRTIARLSMLYKMRNRLVFYDDIKLQPVDHLYSTRFKEYAYKQPITTRDYYKYSFYPRTISEWNKLPREIVLSSSLAAFKNAIFNMY